MVIMLCHATFLRNWRLWWNDETTTLLPIDVWMIVTFSPLFFQAGATSPSAPSTTPSQITIVHQATSYHHYFATIVLIVIKFFVQWNDGNVIFLIWSWGGCHPRECGDFIWGGGDVSLPPWLSGVAAVAVAVAWQRGCHSPWWLFGCRPLGHNIKYYGPTPIDRLIDSQLAIGMWLDQFCQILLIVGEGWRTSFSSGHIAASRAWDGKSWTSYLV